jgi:hypothetical protein
MGKHDMKRRLLKWNKEPPKLWPLWLRILVGIGLLLIVARIVWVYQMG